MTISDPIADLLTRIRNALKAEHRFTEVRWSKMKQSICEILKSEGLIFRYEVKEVENQKVLVIYLKYDADRHPVINGLRRLSKPGRRVYMGYEELRPFFGRLGVTILSTPKGVMTGSNAKKNQVGGEALCQVW